MLSGQKRYGHTPRVYVLAEGNGEFRGQIGMARKPISSAGFFRAVGDLHGEKSKLLITSCDAGDVGFSSLTLCDFMSVPLTREKDHRNALQGSVFLVEASRADPLPKHSS